MAQYQITVDQELLQQLFLGHSQDAGVSKLLESVLNQILQAQVTEQLGAERYERTDSRQGYRNAAYPHQLTTRVEALRYLFLGYEMVNFLLNCLPVTNGVSRL